MTETLIYLFIGLFVGILHLFFTKNEGGDAAMTLVMMALFWPFIIPAAVILFLLSKVMYALKR